MAVNELLSTKYPMYKIYGKEIKEGYTAPSFFTEILDKGSRANTKNFVSGGFTVKIIYFQKEKNELDQLKKVDEIKNLFGLIFFVGERRLLVREYSHDFIGEYSDILQISIDINYKENTKKEDTAPIAAEAFVDITQG